VDVAFAAGSTVAAFAQGLVLGGLLQGIDVRKRPVRGRAARLAHAVRALDRCALIVGYALSARRGWC